MFSKELAFNLIEADPVAYMRAIEESYREIDARPKQVIIKRTRAEPRSVAVKKSPAAKKCIIVKEVRTPERRIPTSKECEECGRKFVTYRRGVHCPGCMAVKMGLPDRKVIFERDDYTCFYCGEREGVSLHIDHVCPIYDGGTDVAGNLVTSCNICNSRKGKKVLPNQAEILAMVKRRNDRYRIPAHRVMVISAVERTFTRLTVYNRL